MCLEQSGTSVLLYSTVCMCTHSIKSIVYVHVLYVHSLQDQVKESLMEIRRTLSFHPTLMWKWMIEVFP